MLAPAALAAPAAVAAPESGEDRNVAFLLAALGLDAMPEAIARVSSFEGARDVPAALALREAAQRAGSVDLGAIATSAAQPGLVPPFGAGDVWVIDVGPGACTEPTAVLNPLSYNGHFIPQGWSYRGSTGYGAYAGTRGVIIDWTTKSFGGAYTGGVVHVAGTSDWFCVELPPLGVRVLFPFINGAAAWTGT